MTGRVTLVVDIATGAIRDGCVAARSEPGRTGLPRPVGVVPGNTGLPFVAGGTEAVGKTVGGFGATTGAGAGRVAWGGKTIGTGLALPGGGTGRARPGGSAWA